MTQASPAGQGAFLDLSARAKFRVTRADRFRFLNGQITNDLRKASETVAVEACVLNAKGKMCASILPFALSTHASTATVSLALRKSFVICPLRNRNLSARVTRNFARAERSRKAPCPAGDACVIIVQTKAGSAAV